MAEWKYYLRSETHLVGNRLEGYNRREKFQKFFSERKKENRKSSPVFELITKLVLPRALTLEIIYNERDYENPSQEEKLFAESPELILREICIDGGRVLQEFKFSHEEAKELGRILSNL